MLPINYGHTLVKILLSPSFGTTKCAKFEHVALQCPFDDPDLWVLSRMNTEKVAGMPHFEYVALQCLFDDPDLWVLCRTNNDKFSMMLILTAVCARAAD